MNWIILSLASLFLSAVVVVIITGQVKKGISTQFVMFIISVIWIFGYGFWAYFEGANFIFPKIYFLLIVIAGLAGVFANWFIFAAAADSPNAGLAFAISNSSSAMVAVLAVFFLGSELSLRRFAGVLVCLLGVVILNYFSGGQKKEGTKKWIAQALLALIFSAVLSLIVVWLAGQGLKISFILLLIAIVYAFSYGLWLGRSKINFTINKKILFLILGVGILSVVVNWMIFTAGLEAPNPGFAFAVIDCKPALIVLMAAVLFKSKFTLKQLVGVVVCIIGVITIAL